MADAKICDRCKNFYQVTTTENRLKMRVRTSTEGRVFFRPVDLCPECQRRLEDWFDKSSDTEGKADDIKKN